MSQRLDWSEYGAVNSVKLLAGGGGEIHLLTGHDDGQLVVSSVNTEAVNTLKVISHHDNILWSIDISRQHVTTCSEDRTVAVYDRAELVSSLPPSHRPSVRPSLLPDRSPASLQPEDLYRNPDQNPSCDLCGLCIQLVVDSHLDEAEGTEADL